MATRSRMPIRPCPASAGRRRVAGRGRRRAVVASTCDLERRRGRSGPRPGPGRAGVLERRWSAPPGRSGRPTGRPRPAAAAARPRPRPRPAGRPRGRPAASDVQVGQAGLGGEAPAASGRRRAARPSSRRISTRAWRPVASIGAEGLAAASGRVGADGAPGRPGLDDDHAHAVGDHVVQLAGDPGRSSATARLGLLGPGPLQPAARSWQLGGQRPLHPGPVAEHPGAGQGERGEGGVDHVGVGPGQAHDDDDHDGRDPAGEQGGRPARPRRPPSTCRPPRRWGSAWPGRDRGRTRRRRWPGR